ncbi:hypothetical protein BSKO_05783 [Bryopsis sp. KO-2023]|nr:hypothetical protein BSKO_05783 [Bryopsis sp. KO-2023]
MPSARTRTTRTLLIDNYDSYTYNLFQVLAEVSGDTPVVVRNDEKSLEEVKELVKNLAIDNIVISPGPGTPEREEDIGVCKDLFRAFPHIPILGVCLGHQVLASVHGGKIVRAPEPVHGRVSEISHDGHALFKGMPSGVDAGLEVVRYHSLMVDESSLPPNVVPIAWTTGRHRALRSSQKPAQQGSHTTDSPPIVMALAASGLPHFGIQFHPESIGTKFGVRLMQNFHELTCGLQGRPSLELVRDDVGPPGHRMVPKAFVVDAEGWEGNLEVCFRKCDGIASFDQADVDRLFDAMFRPNHGAPNDSFWLDSAATDRGRYSFMGGVGGPLWRSLSYTLGKTSSPEFKSDLGTLTIRDAEGNISTWHGDLWDYLEREMKCNRVRSTPELLKALPFNFWGGYVGYLGYELKALCGGENAHRSPTPDACFLLADRLIAIDHRENDVYCVAMKRMDSLDSSETSRWLDSTCQTVLSILGGKGQPQSQEVQDVSTSTSFLKSTLQNGGHESALQPGGGFSLDRPHATYTRDIESCLEYMHAGESYEICLTNKLRRAFPCGDGTAKKFYSLLRRLNPAPYAAFLNFPSEDMAICCSSPERFLKGDRGGVLEARPIKGTASRHSDKAKDEAAAHALATSEKDQAENLMIVDLLRNDLGRVCESGSVYVPSLMKVESHTTVHQLVSTVKGNRRRGVSVASAIRAAFPGGSMTGAPKIRTMSLIDGLEKKARGVYSGSIGYIGFNDAFDLNIVIRTAVLHKGEMSIGAGGAIVVQSGVQDEFDEMLLKTKALIGAVKAYEENGPV